MRLTLLCHAATRSMREGGFPSPDEPLDEGGERKIAALDLPKAAAILCSPARAARQTMELAGLSGAEDATLRDIEHGDWSGRSFAAVHASDPGGLTAWMADPTRAAPGGERFDDLVARMTPWLDDVAAKPDATLAITHPMVMRAVIVAAIGISAEAAMRIDCAPLTRIDLSYNRLWRLQAIRPL
ncbi:histidine phosphatase family protein [Sphingomonas crocodyli]|uniref:Histidine phosphatase family protein n=1 Tax=Sphingomonas crocodyli TaxID=1979270 RepID=A0A437M686_9SPHN|nr:histidine phosphatase family protein [Sphingomonas crocodyli]RVT93159.1 histidine phosphatase family protein [Sphingomonas crocodyli]